MRLHGKKALVIGSAVGIGRAVSEAFAKEGADVALADFRKSTELNALTEHLISLGSNTSSFQVDVRVETSVADLISQAISRLGHIDILVNNAGITSSGCAFQDQDWNVWTDIFNVNLKGVAFGMKHVIPHMRARGYGRIINTSSQLAHKPIPRSGAYCASKAAVTALSASVAQEVAEYGITVNCVCPGITNTAMLNIGDRTVTDERIKALPIRRVGEPEEIATAYVYLASDEAAFFVGQSLSPNGGDVMW